MKFVWGHFCLKPTQALNPTIMEFDDLFWYACSMVAKNLIPSPKCFCDRTVGSDFTGSSTFRVNLKYSMPSVPILKENKGKIGGFTWVS